MLQGQAEIPVNIKNLSRAGTPTRGLGSALVLGAVFLEELGQFLGHGAAQFLRVNDGHGALVVARHIMAYADGDKLDGGFAIDVGNPCAGAAP